jgi:hypothetical protein
MCVRLDHDRQSSVRLKSNRQFPYLMNVRPDHSYMASGWVYLNCDSCLRRRASGWDTTSSGRLIDLPFIRTWKESEAGRVQRGVRTGCWVVWTDASWTETSLTSGGSRRKWTSSEWILLGLSGLWTVWHVVRTDGIVDIWASGRDDTSSWWLTGNRKSSDSEALLNSRIPVKQLYKQVFLSNTE